MATYLDPGTVKAEGTASTAAKSAVEAPRRSKSGGRNIDKRLRAREQELSRLTAGWTVLTACELDDPAVTVAQVLEDGKAA